MRENESDGPLKGSEAISADSNQRIEYQIDSDSSVLAAPRKTRSLTLLS